MSKSSEADTAALLEALKRMPIRPDQGICGNLRTLTDKPEVMDSLREIMDKWPQAYPNRFYPVEGHCSIYLSDARCRTLWSNPRRHALLDWLIEELEK